MQEDAAGQLAADIDQALRVAESQEAEAAPAQPAAGLLEGQAAAAQAAAAAAAAAAALDAVAAEDMELMEQELLVRVPPPLPPLLSVCASVTAGRRDAALCNAGLACTLAAQALLLHAM